MIMSLSLASEYLREKDAIVTVTANLKTENTSLILHLIPSYSISHKKVSRYHSVISVLFPCNVRSGLVSVRAQDWPHSILHT